MAEMEDLRTILRIARRRGGVLLAVAGLIALSVWLAGGGRLSYVDLSPDATYRVEFHTAPRWRHLVHREMRSPGFVRLRDNFGADGLSRTTQLVDLAELPRRQVLWTHTTNGEVAVGRNVRFRRVPPLTSAGQALPLSAGESPR